MRQTCFRDGGNSSETPVLEDLQANITETREVIADIERNIEQEAISDESEDSQDDNSEVSEQSITGSPKAKQTPQLSSGGIP